MLDLTANVGEPGPMPSEDDRKARAGTPPSSPNIGRLKEQLESYMEERGLRSTGQRRRIIECFFDCQAHVTIDDLLELVRKQDPGIGYATVYRTMKMLAAGGVAHEHKFSDGMTRYELADDEAHHDHLICVECGRIQEFEEPLIEELQQRIAKRFGFEILDHKHELYGVCDREECRAKARAKPQSTPPTV